MAVITKGDIINQANIDLGLNPAAGSIRTISENAVPTFEIGPRRSLIFRAGTRSTTGDTTLMATQAANVDFYLVAAGFSITKDVTSDCILGRIGFITEGQSRTIVPIVMQSVTAGSFNAQASIPYPLKIDREENIYAGFTSSVGSTVMYAWIVGFYA
jgi:hypothetical protein